MRPVIVTVVGTLIADPVMRTTNGGVLLTTFRVASTARRSLAGPVPAQEETLFMNVVCWRDLAANAAASLRGGTPVVVHGVLRTRTVERAADDGTLRRRTFTDIHAQAVGPNLSGGVTKFWPAHPAAVRAAEERVLREAAALAPDSAGVGPAAA